MPFPLIPVLVVMGATVSLGALSMIDGREAAHRRLLRELQSGATRSIDGLRHREIARVVGVVEPTDRVVRAPLSGRHCVAWELSIWRAETERAWKKVATAVDHVPFSLRDAGGRALVRVDRVQSYGVVDHEERHDSLDRVSDSVRAYLSEHGLLDELPPDRPLHLKESVLEVGETAVVVGHVRRRRDDGSRATYRESAHLPEVILGAPKYAAVLFSDAPEAIDARVSQVAPR